MGAGKLVVKLTANFATNLEAMGAFWSESGFPQAYDRLLDELADNVIPNLERFPAMGRPFLARQPDSVESISRQERLRAQLGRLGEGGDIREYLMADYLILYAVVGEAVYLLSIRHHKQLSFDVAHLWIDRTREE